ncbi:hypothetical protein BH23VER1_BH23VER1_18890 [soil metagenome]
MTFKAFIIGIGLTFGLPWVGLVALPYAHFGALEPVPFDPEADEIEGVYPMGEAGIAQEGRAIYRREGCANCHTQVIRPDYAGMDSFKQAYGKDPESLSPNFTRQSLPYDYAGHGFALIGQVRHGPDLSNAGYRRPDPDWHYRHLYDPRSIHRWSSMPAFRHLFEKRPLQGQIPQGALPLEQDGEVDPGYIIVPTADARALVGYLTSLRLPDKVPASLRLPTPQAAAPVVPGGKENIGPASTGGAPE